MGDGLNVDDERKKNAVLGDKGDRIEGKIRSFHPVILLGKTGQFFDEDLCLIIHCKYRHTNDKN